MSPADAAKVGAGKRIDVHHHLCPPDYAEEANKIAPLFKALRDWTPQRSIDDMDEAGVTTAILSMSTPGVWLGGGGAARRLARYCNDYMARLQSDHPGRFGIFATVPMPDVEGSLREIEYAFDVLKVDGVCLFTSYGTKYLGDPEFMPVLLELNRRKAVIYTHPTISPCVVNLLPVVSEAIIEYGVDTTRAMANLLFTGAMAQLRDARFIFSHAGGTMPYLVQRFLQHVRGKPEALAKLPEGLIGEVRRFFYDTAQAFHPVPMGALCNLVGAERILFGTDFPWGRARMHVAGLSECDFSVEELARIYHDNALSLLSAPGVRWRGFLNQRSGKSFSF
jgi:6-methylsalicylate decarboxylase